MPKSQTLPLPEPDPTPTYTRVVIRRPAARCFAAFCDVLRLRDWLPGLSRARVVQTGEGGLPVEVLFEYGPAWTYVLRYGYDVARRRVEWAPTAFKRDAVAGFAEFAEHADGCEMTYMVRPASDHAPPDRAGDPRAIVDAFAKWIGSQPG